ncbi:MAG TPA: universal stress protein [Steroidobacteraceae bacterium]|nr:universal stress protein [Steroidobacteraceae bacterium]
MDATRVNEGKVLACVDQSQYADHVADYAAWAARRLDAPLEFLHVIDQPVANLSRTDHSGAIGLGAQERLLDQLAGEDETRARDARERGRIFLNRLRERAVAAHVDSVDVRQRFGDLAGTLAEQQQDVRLVVLGRRGESAKTTRRDLGRNVERIVRALDQPVLTVTDDFIEPRRIMIAFDGSVVTRHGVEMVAASPLFRGLPVFLLMAGKGRSDGPRQIEWARTLLVAAGFDVSAALQPGDAETMIARAVEEQGIDLLVMGAYGHSLLRSRVVGSKTTDLLRSSSIPTLLLRR